jgi:hypothetical protein
MLDYLGGKMKTPEEIAADAAAEWIKNSTTSHSLANACALYGYNAGFLAGYQAAKDQFADSSKVMPQWISVKDRLPEIWDDYLAFGYGPTIPACCFVAAYDPKINKWYEMSTDWDLTETIKYWMPLPKTPEDE